MGVTDAKAFRPFARFAVMSILVSQVLIIIAMLVPFEIDELGKLLPGLLLAFIYGLIYAAGVLLVILSLGYGIWRVTLRFQIRIWIAAAVQGILASATLAILLSPMVAMLDGATDRSSVLGYATGVFPKIALVGVPVAIVLSWRSFGHD